MIDDRHRELINASIDGMLSQDDQEYLSHYLSQNSEAKTMHDQLRELSQALSMVNEAEPPPQLRHNILQAIRMKQEEKKQTPMIIRLATAALDMRNRFAYVYVFTAGIVLGVALSSVVLNLERETQFDNRDLSGTLSTPPTKSDYKPVDRVDFAEAAIQGSMFIGRTGNSVLVELTVDSREEIEVIAQFSEDEMRLTGFRHLQEGISGIAVSEGRVQFKNRGENQYHLFFNDRGPAGGMLHLRIYSATGLLYEHRMNVINSR